MKKDYVAKTITNARHDDADIDIRINSSDVWNSANVNESFNAKKRVWHAMASFNIIVVFGFMLKLKAFLDIGAEVNVMTRQIMEDAGLVMRQGLSLKLI